MWICMEDAEPKLRQWCHIIDGFGGQWKGQWTGCAWAGVGMARDEVTHWRPLG